MADDKNSHVQNIPSNTMRLADKFKKLKDGVTLHTYTEHTEDKGADTEITEAVHGGKVISRFVQKDGKTIESMGSEDAQSSGKFDEIAKKVGGSDAITHTKPEQVSEIAHDNQPSSVRNSDAIPDKVSTKKPKVNEKLDNNQEASKEKFINNTTPKETEKVEKSGIHYSTGDKSVSYDRGGVPRAPKMQKNSDIITNKRGEKTVVAGSAPGKKVVTTDSQGNKILPAGYVPWGSTQKPDSKPLKKWKVFMDSTRGFADPLRKEPLDKGVKTKNALLSALTLFHADNIQGKPQEKEPVKQKTEHVSTETPETKTLKKDDDEKSNRPGPMGMWDVLGRKKKQTSGLSRDAKIKAALDKQKAEGSPYAEKRTGVESMLQNRGKADVDPKYAAAMASQKKKEPIAPKPTDPVAPVAPVAPEKPKLSIASVTENPIKRKGRKKTKHISVAKSMISMLETLRKGDVIDFKKKEVPVSAFEKVFHAAKKKEKLNPPTDDTGVPHKFWEAYRGQEHKKRRQEDAKKIPIPGAPVPEEPDNIVPIPKTEKSSVIGAAKKPTQASAQTPSIKNAVETTIGTKPVKREDGLVKAKDPTFDPKVSPQHLPSAENGLEAHLNSLQAALKQNEAKLIAAQDKSKYSKDTPKEKRDRSMKMAERTHKYLKMGIELTKLSIAARDSDSPNWKGLIGTGNPKVNQMGILTFGNTLPGHNCPARGGCGDGSCYGMNGQQAMGNALELRARNSGLIQRPDFVQGAINALQNAPKHLTVTTGKDMYEQIKDHPRFKSILLNKPTETKDGMVRFKVKSGDTVRWHDTGDIINEKHLDDIASIAKHFPEKKFYLYTKSLHLPLDKLRALPNFNVIQSFGGQHNDKLDTSKPHAKFFPSLEDAGSAGYTPVWWHDWDAASGVKNLALVPHGSRQKEVDVTGFNEGVTETPEQPQPIKKSGTSDHEPAWMQFDQPDSVAQSVAMGVHGKMRAMTMLSHKHDEHPVTTHKSAQGNHPASFVSGVLSKADGVKKKTT